MAITPVATEMNRNRDGIRYTEMRFPDEIGPHAIVLNFSSYSSTPSGIIGRNGQPTSIALPIPNNIVDTFNMRVAGYELGAMGNLARTGAGEVGRALRSGGDVDWDAIGRSTSAALGGRAIAAGLARLGMPDNVRKGVEVGAGAIQNPFMALTFDGIDLKTHNFSWQLAPSSASESDKLNRIIQKIKREVLPSYSDATRSFLRYPSVVDIFFEGTTEGFLYPFKRCMVNSFETNYAGAGMPAFVEGGKPAVVTVTMSLTEMEIWTKEDFGDVS